MKRFLLLIAFACMAAATVRAQKLTGTIYDDQTREPLAGANVTYIVKGETRGVVSQGDGRYEINLPEGGANINVSFMGYESLNLPIVLDYRQTLERDIYMKAATNLLENIVVSAGRFEQPISEVTVSMDILKTGDIDRQTPTDLSEILNTLPGVDINDKQPSIRGGNGWTYGVGSRSQILVDGMSVLTPGSGEINWNVVPMENVEQIEVLKGASSVLYGSSALNGVINLRTARPGLVPQTKVKLYAGIYGNPSNENYKWWDNSLWKDNKYQVKPLLRNSIFSGIRNPMYEGIDISHSRRIGNFDVSGGLNFLTDEGYRQFDYNKRFNINGNITYHQPMAGDYLMNYGTNFNFLTNKYGEFFIWRSPLEAYQPSAFADMGREGNSFNIEPFFNFTNRNNNTTHEVRGRFYYRGDNFVTNTNDRSIIEILGNMGTDVSVITDIVGGDYSSLYPLVPILTGTDVMGLLNSIQDGNFGDISLSELNNLVNGARNVLNTLFPTGTTSDYSDLIGWFMSNGLPDGMAGIVPWFADVVGSGSVAGPIENYYDYYADYKFSKKFGMGAQITAGMTYQHTTSDSETTGTHNSDNIAGFFQYDQRFFDRLSVSLGVRGEYYRVDDLKKESETKIFGTNIPFKPVFRGGINYKLAEYSFLRASFGQGYRYPSLTEKYARRDVGGAGVYPNPELKAESGFNAEIGLKQGYKIGNFQGFLDIAGFYTQYKNMIEFRFGIFDNETFAYVNSIPQFIGMMSDGHMPGVGAMFYNIDKARISGIDVSTTGAYIVSPEMRVSYNVGYVFIEPVDANYKEKNKIEAAYTDPLQMKEKSNTSRYLKYRQKHTVKGTFDFEWNRFSLGTNMTWKSRTLAVDYFMVDERAKPDGQYQIMDYVRDIIFGNIDGENLETYWKRKNQDYFIMDLRTGVKASDKVGFQFSVNNLFNKEYSTRPMSVSAPRTYILQINYTF